MEVLLGFLLAALGLLLVVVIKLSTTFFHELGHAIPALMFTSKKVTVYVGSYGDISRAAKLRLGRLLIYFRWNVFDWKIGMCQQEETISANWQRVIVLLGGPLASILVAIPLIANYQAIAANSFLTFVSLVFIASAVYDFIVNMLPVGSPIAMHDGGVAYSDGFVLYSMLARRFAPAEFFELEERYDQGKYAAVIERGREIIEREPTARYAYDFMIDALNKMDDPEGALEVYEQLHSNIKLQPQDYLGIGRLYKSLGNYREALKYFEHYRYHDYTNCAVLYEIGTTQIEQGESREAIQTLSTLLSIDETHIPAYLSRSLAFINEQDFAGAREDLKVVMDHDENTPAAYYHLGLMAEREYDYSLALQHYRKAKALGYKHHGLDYRLAAMSAKVGEVG